MQKLSQEIQVRANSKTSERMKKLYGTLMTLMIYTMTTIMKGKNNNNNVGMMRIMKSTIQHLTVAKKRVNRVMIDKNISYGPILGYVVNHERILRNKR